MTASSSEITQVGRKRLAQVGVSTIRRVPQQVDAFLCQNLRSEAFPYSNRKFVHCRNTRDERDACTGSRCSQIKLISNTRVWNCSYAIGNANCALDGFVGFGLLRG